MPSFSRLCMASAVTGFLATYGVDEPACCYDDLDKCDVLILWGNNPAEMHPVLFSRMLEERRRRDVGCTLLDCLQLPDKAQILIRDGSLMEWIEAESKAAAKRAVVGVHGREVRRRGGAHDVRLADGVDRDAGA